MCACVLSLCPFTLLVPRCTLNHLIHQLWYTICGHTHAHTQDRTFFNAELVDSKSLSGYFIRTVTLQWLADIDGGRVKEKER